MKSTTKSKGMPKKGSMHVMIISMPGKNTPKPMNGDALKPRTPNGL